MLYKTKCCFYTFIYELVGNLYSRTTIKKPIAFTDYLFRYDPVPHIHKRKFSNCLRHMKTTQELRTNQIDYFDVEEEFNVRIKYRKRDLPTVRDDYFRSYPKGWKDCSKRRTQYKSH